MAAALLALCALLVFLSAVLTARRAQRAAYYSTRRQLNETANRRLGASLVVFLVAGLVWLTSLLLPRPPAAATPTTAAPPSPVAQRIVPKAAPTALPAATPTPTLTPTPTAMPPTATPSPRPIPEPTSSLLPPAEPTPTPAQAAPDERLALLAIASGIGADGAPVGVTTSFSTEAKSIYIFFTYQDVPPSALLRHAWFRDGGSVFFGSKRLPARVRGQDHIVWSPSERLQPGLYEVRLSLGGVLQFVANFEVRQD
jgi:hypothetical protein